MRVVSNTSPICNLAVLGRLELLRIKFARVVIPEAVSHELSKLEHEAGRACIKAAMSWGWLVVEAVPDRSLILVLRNRIDEGEAEAIELARQTNADLLIIDDLDGRIVAAEEGLPYTGLLDVLAEERMAGRIPSLKTEIDLLRKECRFFVAEALELKLLHHVGEA